MEIFLATITIMMAALLLAASPARQPSTADTWMAGHEAKSPGLVAAMPLERRMRTFQGAYHNYPDDSLWYGWSEMQRDLSEIRAPSKEMRSSAAAAKKATPAGKET